VQLLENMKAFVAHLLRNRPKATDVAIMIGDESDRKTTSDNYFNTVNVFAKGGPVIGIDPATVIPTSVGYFR